MTGINKRVSCEVCFKIMRSNHLNRHIKIHDVEAQLQLIKRIQNAYKQMVFKRRDVYDFKLFLGGTIYEILQKGKIQISHLTSEQKEALDIYKRECDYKKLMFDNDKLVKQHVLKINSEMQLEDVTEVQLKKEREEVENNNNW